MYTYSGIYGETHVFMVELNSRIYKKITHVFYNSFIVVHTYSGIYGKKLCIFICSTVALTVAFTKKTHVFTVA
jgi:hypothetical protein